MCFIFRRVRKKLQKKKPSGFISCLSVRQQETTRLQLDDFSWQFILRILLNSSDIMQFWLKWGENKGYFTRRPEFAFENISLSHTPLTREQWCCYGSEVIAIPLISSTVVLDLNKSWRHNVTVMTNVWYLLWSESSFVWSSFRNSFVLLYDLEWNIFGFKHFFGNTSSTFPLTGFANMSTQQSK
jgi:hypothetical protein